MIEVVLVDMRSRELIIKGQEVLTADKVALRVSIVAQFAVIDPKAAVHAVESYQGRLYSDVQLAARRMLVRMPLEEILTNLNRLSSKILEDVKEIAAGYGVNIARADVRDLSFPGNVQELMNRVFIDRTNIAMAIPAMRTELGLSASAIGFATGTFFWGYIILQIPAGRIAAVWSAKWVILSLLLFWSLVSLSTAYVRTENELVLNRFALGLFQGGVLTCTIVLIRKWFTRIERARANTMFLISIPIASVIANPISGLVLANFGWQMMFVVEP